MATPTSIVGSLVLSLLRISLALDNPITTDSISKTTIAKITTEGVALTHMAGEEDEAAAEDVEEVVSIITTITIGLGTEDSQTIEAKVAVLIKALTMDSTTALTILLHQFTMQLQSKPLLLQHNLKRNRTSQVRWDKLK